MRIVIWGLGKIFERYQSKISEEDIVCFVDNSVNKLSTINGKNIISPNQLKNYEYDYVVVFSSKYYDDISYQLVMELGVDCGKVVIWEYYLGRKHYNLVMLSNIINTYCRITKIKSILDIGGIFSRKQILNLKEVCNIDLFYNLEEDIYVKGYENIYASPEKILKKYDLMLIDDTYQWKIVLEKFELCAKTVLFVAPFKDLENVVFNMNNNLKLINFSGYLFGYIKRDITELRIFEATHKKFNPINKSYYIPIHAGGKDHAYLGYLKDDTGDHISGWNSQINECTVLYWIWKNQNSEILGLNHYRRFFKSLINSFMIQELEIKLLLEQYDIIVVEKHLSVTNSIETELKSTVCEEAFKLTMEQFIRIFSKMSEDEYAAFQYVFQGHVMYPRNMFITSKKILSEYCSWLFPILFEVLNKVSINKMWDEYSKRVIGFFAERLFTVWLVQQKYKIKELPILLVGDGKPYGM